MTRYVARVMLIIALLIVCFTCALLAQGEYLRGGESGIGFSGALSRNDGGVGVGGSFGYSAVGKYDIGFSLLHSNLDETDASSMSFAPSLAVHVRKDTSGYPIASIHASYQYETVSSRSLVQSHSSLTGDFFTFGFSLLATFSVSSKSSVQPSIDASVVTGTTKLNSGGMYSIENTDTKVVGIVSLSLISRASSKNLIVLTPAVALDKDNTTVALAFQVIFVVD